MNNREITFISGDIVTYNLASSKLNLLVRLLSATSLCAKVAENVYHVDDLELLDFMYNFLIISPEKGTPVSKVYFFSGEYMYKTLDVKHLKKHLETLRKDFSYSKITDDTYKICPL